MDRKYRFHLLGLVHLPCTKEFISCAFTQKNLNLAKMLISLGHEVFYYGAEGSEVPCTEFVQTHTLSEIRKQWGDGDNRFSIGYDWHNADFRHDFNDRRAPVTEKFYRNAVLEIERRKRPDDFLLMTQGFYQKPIADLVKLYLTCEPGIGYRGSLSPKAVDYRFHPRAFESSYIQNFTYGSEAPYECSDGSFYDRVIPNYFDLKDFKFTDEKDDYFLFIGRMIRRKGIQVAYEVCKALNKKLVIVGQGAHVTKDGWLVPLVNPDFRLPPGNWEYVGFADVEKRKRLMSKALAVIAPTLYLECFGGTHVEAMLFGTPPITTNFGVFPGTIPDVLNGVVGFRCNTLQDFVDAARKAPFVDHRKVREYGERFSMDKVKFEYQKWFDDMYQVYLSTLDTKVGGWNHLEL